MSKPASAIFFIGPARQGSAHGGIVTTAAQGVAALERETGKPFGLGRAGSHVRFEHLPQSLTGATTEPARRTLGPIPSVTFDVGATLEQAERELIEITLTYTKNNRTRAAEILGINQKTLYNKLKEYGEGPSE